MDDWDDADGPAELTIDPMVDVVFLLLVFFIFTFNLKILETRVAVPLARPGAAATADGAPPRLTVYAGPDGGAKGYAVDGVPAATLAAATALLGPAPALPDDALADEGATGPGVALLTDRGLRYDAAVETLAAVRALGWAVRVSTLDPAASAVEYGPTPGR